MSVAVEKIPGGFRVDSPDLGKGQTKALLKKQRKGGN